MISGGWLLKHVWWESRRYTSYWNTFLLPPQRRHFTHVCDSVHRGEVVSQHALQVSRPTPRGEVEGSGLRWVSRHTPGGSPGPHPGWSPGPHPGGGLQAHTWGGLQAHTQGGGLQAHTWGIPACTEADSPHTQLLLRAVSILLECILVLFVFRLFHC